MEFLVDMLLAGNRIWILFERDMILLVRTLSSPYIVFKMLQVLYHWSSKAAVCLT